MQTAIDFDSVEDTVGFAATAHRWAHGDQYQALGFLARCWPQGLTDFELAARTGRKQTSIGKRRGELVQQGLVEDSGKRRPSDTGYPAKVWRVTELGAVAYRESVGRA